MRDKEKRPGVPRPVSVGDPAPYGTMARGRTKAGTIAETLTSIPRALLSLMCFLILLDVGVDRQATSREAPAHR